MNLWKLSAGTACVIGKKKVKTDVLPTTAYIMLGDNCKNNCQFCAQSQASNGRKDLLSRVTWPSFTQEEAAMGIEESYETGKIKRACLQVVDNEASWQTTQQALAVLQQRSAIPICVSSHLERVEQVQELIAKGAERICIALDGATPKVYETVKTGRWSSKWELLLECAKHLPGHITTHLIVGLGESEEEMVQRIAACIKEGITVGLFAFTPIPGTPWAEHVPPALDQYRRIQIAHSLLKAGYEESMIQYKNGTICDFAIPEIELRSFLASGQAFQTSGCNDCNRPYYNERPGNLPYNYPRQLTALETTKAIEMSGICKGEYHEMAAY